MYCQVMSISNLKNPDPILKQYKSSIVTNTLIPDNVSSEYILHDTPIQNPNKDFISNLHSNYSHSFTTLLDDFFEKPDDQKWSTYIVHICKKNNILSYLGFTFLTFSFIILLYYTSI